MTTPETLIGPRLALLQHEIEAGSPAALADFWQEVERQGTPLIAPVDGDDKYCLVSFVYRAPDDSTVVGVGGQLTRLGHTVEPMRRMPGTDVLHRTYRLPSDLRGEYRLVFGEEERPDPLNPHHMVFPAGEDSFAPHGQIVSLLELPAAPPQPWIKPRPGVTPGRLEQTRFRSVILGNERLLSVYTPAGYQPESGPYPLVVIFDRWPYAEVTSAPTVLDNLIAAGAVPPLVAVMISHLDFETRWREMTCNPDFAEFLAQELVPWVRQQYPVTTDPAHTLAVGTSLGGLTAAYVGWRHPEIFGKLLCQSGSFQFGPPSDVEAEWLTRQFATNPRQPLSFYVEAGLGEVGPSYEDGPSLLLANRHFRDVLQAKGYRVHYSEFSGAHVFPCWQGTFADGLLALIGSKQRSHNRPKAVTKPAKAATRATPLPGH